MHGAQTRSWFCSDELTISNRWPGEGLWWSEKAQKGTKRVRSKQSPSSLLDGERGNDYERACPQQIHRDSPRHHIQGGCPESCHEESGGWWCTQAWLPAITAAYVDKAKISLAQGTLWAANSHWEAGEAPGRACWSSTVLLSTPLAVPRLAGGKLTRVQWLLRKGTVQMIWVCVW